ncbi:hypothetical protein BDFG_09518, partial [Blastomyces dermatitidis ATCC 26199]
MVRDQWNPNASIDIQQQQQQQQQQKTANAAGYPFWLMTASLQLGHRQKSRRSEEEEEGGMETMNTLPKVERMR